ncbi:MAG: hypothetical protein O2966_02170 [Proteobacteria bacterium]|nr:hypothetical protein [Pseudomonadota bacterium]
MKEKAQKMKSMFIDLHGYIKSTGLLNQRTAISKCWLKLIQHNPQLVYSHVDLSIFWADRTSGKQIVNLESNRQ